MADDSWTTDDVLRWSETGFLQELKEYELRMDQEPIRFSLTEWPGSLGEAFDQARECYRRGLFVATVGMCRVILETVVASAEERLREPSWPAPIDPSFKNIVNCFRPEILSPRESRRAKEIWDDCNVALHEPGANFGEEEAWLTLQDTATIASALIKQRGIRSHS